MNVYVLYLGSIKSAIQKVFPEKEVSVWSENIIPQYVTIYAAIKEYNACATAELSVDCCHWSEMAVADLLIEKLKEFMGD